MGWFENISLKIREICHLDLGLLSSSLPLQRRGSLDQMGCRWVTNVPACMVTGMLMAALKLPLHRYPHGEGLGNSMWPEGSSHSPAWVRPNHHRPRLPFKCPRDFPWSKKLKNWINLNKKRLSLYYSFHLKTRKKCKFCFGAPAVCEVLEMCVSGTDDVVVNWAQFSRRHRNEIASVLVGARPLPRPRLMGRDKQKASSRRKQLSRGAMRAWGWGPSRWACQVEESSILSQGRERRVGEHMHSQSCSGSCQEPGN